CTNRVAVGHCEERGSATRQSLPNTKRAFLHRDCRVALRAPRNDERGTAFRLYSVKVFERGAGETFSKKFPP
ncbi:MAG: hypothetical protein LBL66_00175, partial [Clostridiales bacterium]|nr:hypothetical protein [Clostridiales bacterium]